jgi:GT2 family glycosyltransferase
MAYVSIIIVNYNGNGLITECLKALGEQSFKDFEILVVDNGSLDGSADEIRTFLEECPMLFPPTRLISLDRNLGFVGGNLKGLDYAVREYIALLNNDTVPEKDWLLSLVGGMDSEGEVGICASKLVNYNSDTIDSAGDGFSTVLNGFKRGEGEKASSYHKKDYVFGACAGAALYRKEMLDEIGFFDDDFFLIHEDTDLNFRAQLAGWRVLYVPTAIAHHKVRSSIGHMSDTAVYYTVRNREFVRIKNVPLYVFLRCLPTLVLGVIMEFFYFGVKHGRPFLYFRAKFDALKMLPAMLRKRKAIMKAKKANYKDLMAIMTPVLEMGFLKNKLKKFVVG